MGMAGTFLFSDRKLAETFAGVCTFPFQEHKCSHLFLFQRGAAWSLDADMQATALWPRVCNVQIAAPTLYL